jgi:hypothetical protein
LFGIKQEDAKAGDEDEDEDETDENKGAAAESAYQALRGLRYVHCHCL